MIMAPREEEDEELEEKITEIRRSAGALAFRLIKFFMTFLCSCGVDPDVPMSAKDGHRFRWKFLTGMMDPWPQRGQAAKRARGTHVPSRGIT